MRLEQSSPKAQGLDIEEQSARTSDCWNDDEAKLLAGSLVGIVGLGVGYDRGSAVGETEKGHTVASFLPTGGIPVAFAAARQTCDEILLSYSLFLGPRKGNQ